MPKIQVNDINIYYELSGPKEGPILVLSNGIMMSTASWGLQKDVLEKHFRVLVYDCRGMWQSDHPDGPYSMEQHAKDLAGLLDALGIEKAHIGGISYGAEISIQFALNYPHSVQSLIIIDGVSEIHPLLKAQTMPWLIAAERNDPELLLKTSYHLNFAESWIIKNQVFIENSIERYAAIDMQSFGHLMRAFFELNFTDQLNQLRIPVLVVAGEEDLIKGREYAKIISDQISNCEFAIVPGSGHALCLEKPALLNTLLIGFVLKNT